MAVIAEAHPAYTGALRWVIPSELPTGIYKIAFYDTSQSMLVHAYSDTAGIR